MNTEPLSVCVLGPRLLSSAVEALLSSIPRFRPCELPLAKVALLLGESWHEPVAGLNGSSPGLVLLGNGTAEQLQRATQAGIHAFIHSNDGVNELSQALDAAANAEDFCSQSLLPAILEALRQSGQSAGVSQSAQRSPLSTRELEVARFAAAGMSNAEIAKHLCVSLATVKFHLGSVFRKLNLSGRLQLHQYFTESSSLDDQSDGSNGSANHRMPIRLPAHSTDG